MNAIDKAQPPILDVRDLEVHFRTREGLVRAVNRVSFSLRRGETLGLVGESGSGKSVTSLALMGLVPNPPGVIAGGSVMFDGVDLLKLPKKRMRNIRGNRMAMIFQDPMTSLNPTLTIGRQLTEVVRHHKGLNRHAAQERAIELLDLVGIPSPARRLGDYPHHLSGGMRQRVMIAIGLACDPEVLIADESTTALDVTIQADILGLFASIRERLGTALILITHDMGVVAGVADRVAVMYGGRIVEQAPVHELFARPRMPYTMGLLRSIPRLDEAEGHRLTPIRGTPPNLARLGEACAFAPRCDFFAAGVCDRVVPPLRPVAPEHRAACLFDVTLDTTVGAMRPAEGGAP